MTTNYLLLCFQLICLLPLASALNPNHREHHPKHITAIYVFGDSLFDSGNNNHLRTNAKANCLPYGIDFAGKPTGRFTNEKTVADYIAILLGLPFGPPYLGLPEHQRDKIKTGINNASAASGILPETSVRNTGILSESLFVFNTGINDCAQNSQRASQDPGAFALHLLKEFSIRLQRLYRLGARKLFVNNLFPAGCFLLIAASMKPQGICDEKKNRMVALYNRKLPTLLHQLKSQLPGFVFVHSDLYKFFLEMRANANKYGILHTWKPCCPNHTDGDFVGHPNSFPCEDRDTHLFFDSHPSQITNYIFVKRCFNESTVCKPLNLKQFMEA